MTEKQTSWAFWLLYLLCMTIILTGAVLGLGILQGHTISVPVALALLFAWGILSKLALVDGWRGYFAKDRIKTLPPKFVILYISPITVLGFDWGAINLPTYKARYFAVIFLHFHAGMQKEIVT